MESEIQRFFKNKTIFLTGGTGFLGKVFLEKILRCTQVGQIYMLIRPKGNKDHYKRVDEMLQSDLFRKLYLIKSNLKEYIIPVSGDCSLPMLGLSDLDQRNLIENVDVIIHAAATVSFNEPLHEALKINLIATIDLIDLAKQMNHLQSFVYVSTAFSNCYKFHMEEKFYCQEVGLRAQDVSAIFYEENDFFSGPILEQVGQKFPNTYTFSKALAEGMIQFKAKQLPVCIFRPGIITGIYSDPIEGWVDNWNGPAGILCSSAHGLLRAKYLPSVDYNANVVPVDLCANMVIVSAWKTSEQYNYKKSDNEPTIYNFVPEDENPISWRCYVDSINTECAKVPVTNMIWFPILFPVKSKMIFKILNFFTHLLPAHLLNLSLLIVGKRGKWVRQYEKVNHFVSLYDYFIEHNFTFDTQNTRDLWNSLSEEDKILFNFDMKAVNWKNYMYLTLLGCRLYVSKDDLSTIPQAQKLYKRLKIYHYVVKYLFFGTIFGYLTWILYIIIGFSFGLHQRN